MNVTPSIIVSLMVAASMIVSACATESPSTRLNGSSWKLVSVGPLERQTPAAAGSETWMEFGRDGQVRGDLGCNSFSGRYAVIGDRVVFSSMLSTLMACGEPYLSQESIAFQVMNGMVRFELKGDALTIYAADGMNVLNLSRSSTHAQTGAGGHSS